VSTTLLEMAPEEGGRVYLTRFGKAVVNGVGSCGAQLTVDGVEVRSPSTGVAWLTMEPDEALLLGMALVSFAISEGQERTSRAVKRVLERIG